MNESDLPSRHSVRRVVLIGSMGVYQQIIDIASALSAAGIRTVIPDAEDKLTPQMSLFDFEEFKRRVSFAHLRRIRHPLTYCVLAVNPDRHGILNYVGPNTFAEIAVAFAQSKKIYLLQSAPEAYSDELSAWRSTSLRGSLDQLISDFREDCIKDHPQMLLL